MYINAKFTRKLLFRQLWFSHTSPSLRPKTFPPSPGNPSPLLQEAPKDKNNQSTTEKRYNNKHLIIKKIYFHRSMGILREMITTLLTFFLQSPVFITEKTRGETYIVTITISLFFFLFSVLFIFKNRLNILVSLAWSRDNVTLRHRIIMKRLPLVWDKQEGGSIDCAAKIIINALCCDKAQSVLCYISPPLSSIWNNDISPQTVIIM